MLDPTEAVYQKPVGDGLKLRTVSSVVELGRVAELNAAVHEPAVGETTLKMFTRHPDLTGQDLVFIENDRGEAVATLCLIPWRLHFGGAELPAAELGIVATREDYRNRGLNRLLMDYFWQRYRERGALLSIIQGIPYFYRQYGYEYAMLPLEGGWRIQPDQIPQPQAPGYSIRPATCEDIPLLGRLYGEQAGLFDLCAERSEAVWQFLLERTPQPEAMQHDTLILLDPVGAPVGYFRIPDFHFYENLLTLDEVSRLDFAAALAVLDHLKRLAGERGKDGIRLLLPQADGLVRLANTFGASSLGVYSWQVSIPDRMAFLRQIGPLLEKRLAESMFTGWTGTLGVNLYKEVIGLTFNAGRLEAVGPAQEDQNTILSVPPTQFVPLAMGGRTISEIRASFPDASARRPWHLLADTLFPKVSTFMATIY